MKKYLQLALILILALATILGGCVTDDGGNDNTGAPSQPSQNQSTIPEDDRNYISLENGISYSDNIATDGSYDKSLFYRNDENSYSAADPCVVYCSDKTSKYYDTYFLYATTGSGSGQYKYFTSKDLFSWSEGGVAYASKGQYGGTWQSTSCWAPEVIYDATADRAKYGLSNSDDGTGVYFIFTSSIVNSAYDYLVHDMGTARFQLDMAVATSLAGPFKMWTGVEKGATIGGVNYGTADGYAKYSPEGYTYAGRSNNKIDKDDPWFNGSAARASLEFQWNNKDKAGNWVDKNGNIVSEGTQGATYINEGAEYMVVNEGLASIYTIDPSPFIAPDGQRYLFFTRDNSGMKDAGATEPVFAGTCIYAVKMVDNDWTQIDYSSLTRITRTRYNMVSQKASEAYNEDAQEFNPNLYPQGCKETATVTFKKGAVEQRVSPANGINEGVQVQYNAESGLYYLTFSMGSYTNATYTVVQCIAYNPMGPYRKLDIEEGGLFLGTDAAQSMDNVFGPGHHFMLDVYDAPSGQEKGDGEMVVIYHKIRGNNINNGRCYAIDRASWVKNSQGILVLHANGPTTAIQPRIYATGEVEYDNVANKATVSVSAESSKCANISALTDGIVNIHSYTTNGEWLAPEPYLPEFYTTTKDLQITLTFNDYQNVRGVLLYGSRDYDKALAYENADGDCISCVDRIEFDVKRDGVEEYFVIESLAYDRTFGMFANSPKIRPGASFTATFDEVLVKEIRIELKNPRYKSGGKIAVSEIFVLGRP